MKFVQFQTVSGVEISIPMSAIFLVRRPAGDSPYPAMMPMEEKFFVDDLRRPIASEALNISKDTYNNLYNLLCRECDMFSTITGVLKMTIEQMEREWPSCPPFEVDEIRFMGVNGENRTYIVSQDNIKEVKKFVNAIDDSMNE